MATRVKFNADNFRKGLMKQYDAIREQQTKRLVTYAEAEIKKIGDSIGMEDTGNLLDSLCWGIWLDGRLIRNGYYRNMQEAIEPSYIHALSPAPPKEEVNGRYLAQLFLSTYKPTTKKGWEVVWASTAPYYAYWEYGHYNKLMGQHVQFTTMSQRYDHIKNTFEPIGRAQFLIEVPTY